MTKGFKTAVAVAGGLAMTLAFGVVSPAAASTAPTEPPGSTAAPAELNNGENVTLKLLADNSQTTSLLTAGVTAAFSALHPNVTFDIEQRPGGTDGDNIVKTRLATNEMADVFFYNSGSLLQALNPTETIVDLTGDPMLDNVVDAFIPTVSQGDGVYGVPFGTGLGGGILYNRSIFEDQGLSVPTTWAEFEANNAALLEAGITPVGASYGTTWTSQLFVLADFYNLSQADPTFAEQYTANEAHYADTPAALLGFQRLQEGYDEGWWNDDYGSATYEDALQMLADGDIAQYPMLTFALPRSPRPTPRRPRTSASSPSPDPMRPPTA